MRLTPSLLPNATDALSETSKTGAQRHRDIKDHINIMELSLSLPSFWFPRNRFAAHLPSKIRFFPVPTVFFGIGGAHKHPIRAYFCPQNPIFREKTGPNHVPESTNFRKYPKIFHKTRIPNDPFYPPCARKWHKYQCPRLKLGIAGVPGLCGLRASRGFFSENGVFLGVRVRFSCFFFAKNVCKRGLL